MIYRLLRTQLISMSDHSTVRILNPFKGCESTTSTCRSRSAALQPAESIDSTHNEKYERGRTPVRIDKKRTSTARESIMNMKSPQGLVKAGWGGDALVDLREKIAEKCGVAEDSFELEYPDADFDEYVRLDEDGFKHVRDMIKLNIIERKSKRQQR